jgi:hypothetical protein
MEIKVWQSNPNAEERLEELRKRDLEVARIAQGLQMRTTISNLEHQIKMLRSMEDSWKLSKLSRLFFKLSRFFSVIRNRLPR